MNAERFTSKEYVQDEAIDFIRICQLEIGQKFLMNGMWWQVRSKEDGRIQYFNTHTRNKHRKESVGAKNQQFVQITIQRNINELPAGH
jgi:hypothetical protein